MAKKRANGEGCIRKRKDGRWEARYTDTFESNPKKKRKSIMGKSRKEVSDKLIQALNDLRIGGGLPLEATQTVQEWLDEWMKTYGTMAYRPTTYSAYGMIIKTYICPCIGNIRLFQLKTTDIQKMFNRLYIKGSIRAGIGLSPATLYKIKNVLSKGLNQAVINKYIAENPVIDLILPSLNTPRIKFFTKKELEQISAALPEDSFGILIAMLIETGIRVGELLALEVSDIDFEEKTIDINKSVSYIKNQSTDKSKFIVHPPTTPNGYRKLHIMPNLEILLKRQIDILNSQRQQCNKQNNSVLLFPASDGGYQSQHTVRKRFIKLQKQAAITDIKTIHSLRHTFVVSALNSGVSIQNIAGVIGHKNESTTLKFYAHYLPTETYDQLLELDKFHAMLFKRTAH